MSVHDQAAAAVLSQLALAADGAVLGLGLAYVAVRSILKFTSNSSALRKIEQAPSIRVSDLRSVLTLPSDNDDSANEQSESGKLVIVRGCVEAKSALDTNWKSLRPAPSGVLVSQESGDKGVILQRTQTCIYNEWRGFFGWTSDLRSLFVRSWKEQESSTVRMVPFILVETGRWPQSDYVIVNMEGSRHPLPLTTVYHRLQPIHASPYTFLQALFGHEYPVGLLDEEKLLPTGKEITAVGICSLKDGSPVIKSCKDLPFFLWADNLVLDLLVFDRQVGCTGQTCGANIWQSIEKLLRCSVLFYSPLKNFVIYLLTCFHWVDLSDVSFSSQFYFLTAVHKQEQKVMLIHSCWFSLRSDLTKDQILVDLDFKTKVLFWSGVVLGSLAVGILGYAVVRNWNRWKEWRQQRRDQQQSSARSNQANDQGASDEEHGDVPDGELCVICLMRRRRSAFVPCGHLVCCQSCALSVERDLSPKCPVCRQTIRNSVRIYDS